MTRGARLDAVDGAAGLLRPAGDDRAAVQRVPPALRRRRATTMAAVVVEARKNGARIPWSYWHDKPLTADEYLAAPLIADPICRYDCDIPVDGVATFVLHLGRAGPGPARTARCYVSRLRDAARRRTRRLPLHWPLDDIMDAGARDRPPAVGAARGSDPPTSTCRRSTTASRRSCGSGSRRSASARSGEAHRFVADGGIDSDAPGAPARAVRRRRARQRPHARRPPDARVLPAARRAGPATASATAPRSASPATRSPHYGGAVAYRRALRPGQRCELARSVISRTTF